MSASTHGSDRRDPLPRTVYAALRAVAARHAARSVGDSIQPTQLVHEAWLRLQEATDYAAADTDHLLASASQAMRWLVVDHARRRRSRRLGTWAESALAAPEQDARDAELLALDEALERLSRTHPDEAAVVEQRWFGGLSVEETARVLDVSTATVKRRWAFARAWLIDALPQRNSGDS
ncbi:MAG: ECF-type sigma factor [Planctomycetota bacterium]